MVDASASEEAHFTNGNPFVWQDDYYDFAHIHAAAYIPIATRIHERLVEQNMPHARILDVGCGTGDLLNALRTLGHQDIEGLEPGPQGKRAAAALHLPIAHTSLSRFSTERLFDCVTLMDVIEHLPDPSAAVSDIKRLLKKGGLLVLNTPNAHSYLARVRGAHWSAISPPAHVHLWNLEALNQLMERSGFALVTYETFGRGLLIGICNKIGRFIPFLRSVSERLSTRDASLIHTPGGDTLFAIYKSTDEEVR